MDNNNTLEDTLSSDMDQSAANRSIELLVREHEKFLKNFIAKRVWESQNVEDIYQTTLLEAMKSFHNFRQESHPRTWLCGIAYNVIRNYAKNIHVVDVETIDSIELSDVDISSSMTTDDPADIYSRDNFVSQVKNASDKLSEEVRQTFALVVDKGKSYEQAAELLGVPVGTIRSRIHRARELLKNNCSL